MSKKIKFDEKKAIKSKEHVRPWLAKFMDPFSIKIAKILHKIGLTPNHVTILSGLFAIIGVSLIYFNYLIFGIISILIYALCDTMDGKIARATSQISKKGRFLDSMTDWVVFVPSFILVVGIKADMVLYSYLILSFLYGRIFIRNLYPYKDSILSKKKNPILLRIKEIFLSSPHAFKIELLILLLINPKILIFYMLLIEILMFIGSIKYIALPNLKEDKK